MYEKPIQIKRGSSTTDTRFLVGRVNHQGKLSFYTGAEGPDVSQRDRWDEAPIQAKEYADKDAALVAATSRVIKYVTKKDTLVVVRSTLAIETTLSDVTPPGGVLRTIGK